MSDNIPKDSKEEKEKIVFYDLSPQMGLIKPGERKRVWMDNTTDEYAYRCLPMNMANMLGWDVQAPCDIHATWLGSHRHEDISIHVSNPLYEGFVHSQFGYGVLTFSVGFIVKTPEGVNLWVKGIPNETRRGITALEGICETDWSPATFTMNWQFTEPNVPVCFKKGDVICRMIPYPRGYIEKFAPESQFIAQADEGFVDDYLQWNRARATFLSKLTAPEPSEEKKIGWQKDYMKGRIGESGQSEHQTKIKTPKVTDARNHQHPNPYPHFSDAETQAAHAKYEAQLKGEPAPPIEDIEGRINDIKLKTKEGRSKGLKR